MSRAGARDHDDLMVLARRGALREAEQRELSRLLAADPALAFAQRAGMECDRLAQAELGDEQLIERVTAAALQRLSLPSAERAAPPRWRVPGFGASTLSIGVLALLGYALVSVLGARGKPEPAPRRDVKVEQPQRAAEGPPPPPTAAAAVGVAPTPEPPVRAQMPSAAELFRRSNQARRRGELASAEAGYRRMIQSYPHAEESRLAQLSLAKLLLARKASQEAEAILRRSVARGAGQLEEEALVLHASSLRTLGRPSAEAAVWRRLLEVFPVSAYAAQARERLAELAGADVAAGP